MEQTENNSKPSGRSTSVISKLGVIVLLSSCFVLGSLLIVTIGVSCTALYYAINKRFKENSETPAADFFRSYRENLLQGIVLTVFLICYLGGAGFFLYYSLFGLNKTPPPGWCLPVAVFLLIPSFFVTMFTFPYLARFKNTVKGTIFHSFTFSMMYLGHNVIMWILFLASIALVILFPPFVLIVPFACGFFSWKLCEPDFNYARLLKDKRDELMREFLDLVRVNMDLRREVEEGINAANKNFVIARAGMSGEILRTALMAPGQEVYLESSSRNVMSVDIPVLDFKTRSADENDIYSYGFAFTTGELDEAVASLSAVFPKMLKLAEVEKSCRLMAAEIEKTRRRVNALEHVIIPDTQESIRYITMKLDENERSTQIRLMKVKDMVLEEAHHYSEKH